MEKLRPFIKVLKNRYVIVLSGAIMWMLFFDRYDLPSQLRMNRQITELETDRNYYADEIQRLKEVRSALDSSPEELERFAREKYFMKKDNEVIFKIDGKEKNK